jgi:hypothetical protein
MILFACWYKGLSQIADFWGYHGTYAQEPAQQI